MLCVVVALRLLLCNVATSGVYICARNVLKASEWVWWFLFSRVQRPATNYRTGLEDRAACAHNPASSSSSSEGGRNGRPITLSDFSIRTRGAIRAFVFFLFRGSFDNVLMLALVFSAASRPDCLALTNFVLECWQIGLPPSYIHLFSLWVRFFHHGGVNDSCNPIDPENGSLLIPYC